ncbi:protein FAM83G [Hyperolius riggenbachi]|uniref:protein FAM83G n=1 Tax=Hyperolius riggenbachi TaxID=752182 RepID=UPI0035A2DC28
MALSQLQCLDNNNINWRSSEAKPEFFYSEEQRLALEALVSKGTESYHEVVKRESIRDFLSDMELAKISSRVEPFDPDTSHLKKNGEGDGEPQQGYSQLQDEEQSLEYWPDRSDCSIPELDLGWPDTVAYRGVTRATVYMQPPIDGLPHIKEVVRKMITQAQKVIAVVMDLFTDVDIFKDMLEAGFKRKVSVYIILNESDVKHFLQMCEKVQMHKGHLKNLRVRSIGGCEFYTRFSTKFKGCLGQKFMFVDGDKAVCGSYSFSWSAARIDRNLVTVLSGQVVESFDRQFQDLYLLSKGVSLKCVPLENEPEPEPIIQPAAMPAAISEAIAKKLINPKYALVNMKSTSEAGKGSKQSEDVKKVPIKPRGAPVEHLQDDRHLHPGLQDLERANMFEYLPTWVEPDPEPGSEILGYINIIDPNIKNAQPSQMNRIKICNTSDATSQYLQHTMEVERQKQESAELSLQNKLSEPVGYHQEPVRSAGNPSRQIIQEPVRSAGNPSRQVIQEPVPVPNNSRHSLSKQASQGQESEPSKGSPSRQCSQDLGYGPSQSNSIPTRQVSLDLESVLNNSSPNILQQISVEESHPSAEIEDVVKQPVSEDLICPDIQVVSIVPSPDDDEGFAALTESSHLALPKPPPVPKPRTVPVTDFISMKNALNTKSSRTGTPTEDIPAPFANGVDGRQAEQINLLIENTPAHSNQDSEELGGLRRFAVEYSSSGSGSLPLSNASSMSEEYYPATSFQRINSDHMANGERPTLHRKLSEGHISRGSYASPLISQNLIDMRPVENGMRSRHLEEELKRVLSSSHPLQGKDRMYSLETPQEKPSYQFTSNGASAGYERFSQQMSTRSKGRGQKESTMDAVSPYRHLNRKSEGAGPRPGYWSTKDYMGSHSHPLSQSPGASENASSPLGIPYSKLSQAKHLKSKMGAANLDSRRRSHGPPGHKDL